MLEAQRPSQEFIALAQHLRTRTRIIELVIQIVPGDELALGAGGGQACRHLLPDGQRLSRAVERLKRLSRGDCGTLRIKTTLCQFLVDLPFYRSYLAHPNLGLPLTTNAVESMCRLIREMLRSSRADSNPTSLLLWATALIRLRPTVTCNGHSLEILNPSPKCDSRSGLSLSAFSGCQKPDCGGRAASGLTHSCCR